MLTEQDIRRMASEELANKFNRLLDNGKNVAIRVNLFGNTSSVLVIQYPATSHYLIKSGMLTVECTDVYMTADDYTVAFRCDVGRMNVIHQTMTTEDVQMEVF